MQGLARGAPLAAGARGGGPLFHLRLSGHGSNTKRIALLQEGDHFVLLPHPDSSAQTRPCQGTGARVPAAPALGAGVRTRPKAAPRAAVPGH